MRHCQVFRCLKNINLGYVVIFPVTKQRQGAMFINDSSCFHYLHVQTFNIDKKQYYRSMRLCLQCWIWLITIKIFYYWYILLYTCTCFIMFLYVTSFFVKYTCQQCYVEIKKNIYRNYASFPTYTFQFSINISMGLY